MLPIDVKSHGTLIYPEGVEPYIIRTSERKNYKSCRRLFDYTSQNRRNLEHVRMNKHLSFGIANHIAAEAFYAPELWDTTPIEIKVKRAQLALSKAIDEQIAKEKKATKDGSLDTERREEYEQRRTLGVGMWENYGEFSLEHDNFTPISVEQKFQMPLTYKDGTPVVIDGHPVVYQLRTDLIAVEHDTGNLVIVDHKNVGSLYDTEHLDLDTAITSYLWAIGRVTGQTVSTFYYNELVKSVPEAPKILKKGDLSKDKRQNTTLSLYLEEIDKRGLDRADYADMLEHLSNNPRQYYRRTPVTRTPAQLDAEWDYVIGEATEMLSRELNIYPNPDKIRCRGCDFVHPCLVANEQGDVEYVLSNPFMFVQREGDPDDLPGRGEE